MCQFSISKEVMDTKHERQVIVPREKHAINPNFAAEGKSSQF